MDRPGPTLPADLDLGVLREAGAEASGTLTDGEAQKFVARLAFRV